MKQQERSELTRRRILEAAMKEFGTRGYDGGTIGNICRNGINKGLIYHHFHGKDDLYLQCVKISLNELMQRLEDTAALQAGEPPDTAENPSALIQSYMAARLKFFEECRLKSRIVFESLLNPPRQLRGEIAQIMEPLEKMNSRIYETTLSRLKLRPGITMEQARKYFAMVQYMFNGYFSSPAMQDVSIEERITTHEQSITQILDCMLYGIARQER